MRFGAFLEGSCGLSSSLSCVVLLHGSVCILAASALSISLQPGCSGSVGNRIEAEFLTVAEELADWINNWSF